MDERPISSEERALRKRAIDFARTNMSLSGFRQTPEADALDARYVAGELSFTELSAALLDHARTLPAGEPVQTCFTSFDEAWLAANAAFPESEKRERRTWQLLMTGKLHGLLSPQLIADLTHLLDLRPDLACIDLDTDAGVVHVARDWPGSKVEEIRELERSIAATPAVRRVSLHPHNPPPAPSGDD